MFRDWEQTVPFLGRCPALSPAGLIRRYRNKNARAPTTPIRKDS